MRSMSPINPESTQLNWTELGQKTRAGSVVGIEGMGWEGYLARSFFSRRLVGKGRALKGTQVESLE